MQRMRFTSLLFLLLVCGIVSAQQTPQAALIEAEAKFRSFSSYSATMGFDMGGHRGVGKVYYQGNKYHWDYVEDLTICNGTTTMNYNRAFASISYPEAVVGPDLSADGVYGLYKFAYQFSWTDSNSVMRRMKLTPPEGSEFPPIQIGIGRKSGLIEEYIVDIRAGLRMEMMVLDFKVNPILDEKLFVIDWEFVKKVEDGLVPPIDHGHDEQAPGHDSHEGHEHEGHDHH